jgi:hypothetical protein
VILRLPVDSIFCCVCVLLFYFDATFVLFAHIFSDLSYHPRKVTWQK